MPPIRTDPREKMAAGVRICISSKRMAFLPEDGIHSLLLTDLQQSGGGQVPGELSLLSYVLRNPRDLYTAAYTPDCVNDIYGFTLGFECSLCGDRSC